MNQVQRKRKKGIIKINLARRSLSAQRVWVDALYAAVGLFHLAATSERPQQAEQQLNTRTNRWEISTDLEQASLCIVFDALTDDKAKMIVDLAVEQRICEVEDGE